MKAALEALEAEAVDWESVVRSLEEFPIHLPAADARGKFTFTIWGILDCAHKNAIEFIYFGLILSFISLCKLLKFRF